MLSQEEVTRARGPPLLHRSRSHGYLHRLRLIHLHCESLRLVGGLVGQLLAGGLQRVRRDGGGGGRGGGDVRVRPPQLLKVERDRLRLCASDGAGRVGASPGLSRPRGGDAARRGGWLRHLSQELPRAVHREVGGEVERA